MEEKSVLSVWDGGPTGDSHADLNGTPALDANDPSLSALATFIKYKNNATNHQQPLKNIHDI